MLTRSTLAVGLAIGGASSSVAAAAPVRSLPLPVATHRVLEAGRVPAASLVASPAGDVALLWSTSNTTRVATRAVGGAFTAPVALPGAFESMGATFDGPAIGVGGSALLTWRNRPATGAFDDGALRVAAADPGRPVALRAPLATPPAGIESPRTAQRTAIAPDGTMAMAVERGGMVRVTQRAPGQGFGPEVVASAAGESPDLTSVAISQDDAGGLVVTWTSTMPCVSVPAPACAVNRVTTRQRGGAFAPPRSLAEVPTGRMPGSTRNFPTQLEQPVAVDDGAGRTVLGWRRSDPGRFDGFEVAVGSATGGFGAAGALPGTPTGAGEKQQGCGNPVGTPHIFGALPTAGGVGVLLSRVSGCGSSLAVFPVPSRGAPGPATAIVSGIGSRAAQLVRRGPKAALVVQSRKRIRAAFWQGDGFSRLRTVGPRLVQRFGPSAIVRDGSLVIEYGRGCAAGRGAASEIAVVSPAAKAPVVRRVGACGRGAPTVLDRDGALVTLRLGSVFEASASCPIPAAIAAQRAGRRPRCR